MPATFAPRGSTGDAEHAQLRPITWVVIVDVGDDTMVQPLDVKRLLATGKQFTESSRSQARHLGSDLVSQGRLATEQISAMIDELAGRGSRARIEELRRAVQHDLRTLRDSMNEDLAKIDSAVDRIAVMVNELGSQRREHAEELREAVRDEVQRQVSMLGLATKDDVGALGRSVSDDLIALESRWERRAELSTVGSGDRARREVPPQVTPPQHPPTT